jgi:hypothetical protein
LTTKSIIRRKKDEKHKIFSVNEQESIIGGRIESRLHVAAKV